METLVIQVEGMSCAHCKQAVERALCDVPGVADAHADVQSGNVTVQIRDRVDEAFIRLAIEEAGYALKA